MTIIYSVKFRPGRYKTIPSNIVHGGRRTFMIGREDDGEIIGFAFEEENAKHLCLALNLLDAHVTDNTDARRELLKEFEKLKRH